MPARLIEDRHLSETQLETIIMANDAHGRDLPGHFILDDDQTKLKLYLLTGLLLPIWKDIPTTNERIYRVTPDGATAMIGRTLSEEGAAGCEGFREFKLRLAQNLAVSMQYLNSSSGDQALRRSGTDRLLPVAAAMSPPSEARGRALSFMAAATNRVSGDLGGPPDTH